MLTPAHPNWQVRTENVVQASTTLSTDVVQFYSSAQNTFIASVALLLGIQVREGEGP